MQGQEQFQSQIQVQLQIQFKVQKVKRLCVALSTQSKLKKNSVNLCVKSLTTKGTMKAQGTQKNQR